MASVFRTPPECGRQARPRGCLEKLDLVAQLGRSIAHELAERLVILLSVDIGLAYAKHINIRPIHHEKFHTSSFAVGLLDQMGLHSKS